MPLCSQEGCDVPAFRVGLCEPHYRATGKGRRKEGPCAECGEIRPLHAGLCNKHYMASRRAALKQINGRAPVEFSRGIRDHVRLTMVLEEMDAGILDLLNQGPCAWPYVEKRLLALHERAKDIRPKLSWQRAILDFERTDPLS